MRNIKIGKRIISEKNRPLIVAEIGINHFGSLEMAKNIVNEAKKSGAEAVKVQIHIPEEEMSEEAKKIIPGNSKKNIYMIIGNNPSEEAIGSLQNIILKGGSSVQDVTGPIISFEKENGFQLRNSDHLEDGEKLYLRLSDPIGINLTGEIGHEILYSDKSNENKSDITHLFIYDENSITTGRILINDLSNENLYFQVKAWDNANNPSEKEIKLFISENKGLILFNVYNYPNPFKNNTQFSFEINESAEIEINIYTLGGRKIRNIDRDFYEAGYNFINWDGKDKYGDNIANGVYLYSLKAFNDGSKISKIGKIAKYQ